MKRHTSRWIEVEPSRRWELRERGAVLGKVEEQGQRFYVWIGADTGGWSRSRYAAQRAVRRALLSAAAQEFSFYG